MKRLVTIVVLLLSIEVQAEILDSTQFVAFYRYILQTQDCEQQNVSDSLRLALFVGTRATECTTVLDFEQNATPSIEMTNVLLTHIPYVLTDMKNSEVIACEPLYPYRYETHESMAKVNWELTDDTLTIGSWLCSCAIGKLHGKQWTVWYSMEIPYSAGPWKLRGLPGLVVKATDEENTHCFELFDIKEENRVINYIQQPEYQMLSRKKFMKLKKKLLNDSRYIEDPIYYLEDQPEDLVELDYEGTLYYVANHMIIPQKAHVYQPLELE